MAEEINQFFTIPNNVVAIAPIAQSLRPNIEQQGVTEMATINGIDFNDNGIGKPTLAETNGHESILNSSVFKFGGNDKLSL